MGSLLAVEVGECNTFVGDAIDIRRSVAHHASAEVTDIPRTDVVTPQDQNVGLLFGHSCSFLLLIEFALPLPDLLRSLKAIPNTQ